MRVRFDSSIRIGDESRQSRRPEGPRKPRFSLGAGVVFLATAESAAATSGGLAERTQLAGSAGDSYRRQAVHDPSAERGDETPDRIDPGGEKLAQRADLDALLARARATARRVAQRARESDRSDLAQSVVRELLQAADRLDYRGEAAFDALVRSMFAHKLRRKLSRARAGRRDVRREVPTADADTDSVATPVDRSPASDPAQVARAAELRALLQARIEELPARTREVLLLRANGLTAAEVAATLGLTEANAQKIYTRARAQIEAALLGDARG